MELKVRGNFEGAPIIPLLALESDYISNTGPYVKTKFAETLWLENKQLADDRFDKIQSDEEEPSGILIGQDQADIIMENKAAIQSPCELRAYKSPLGLIIGGASQENPSKSSQKIIQQLISNSINSSQHAVTSFTTTFSNASRVYPNDPEKYYGTEADTLSLLNPAETGTSFSENKDGPTKKEKKRFDKDEQRAINFDLSLF